MARRFDKLTFSVSLERGLQRFRELIVYIASKSVDDPSFGATKLNKILYHSDFRAFERFGVPLTGAPYFRLKNGPAPRVMVPVRDELVAEGVIEVVKKDLGNGYVQHRVIARRNPVLEHFTADEIALVDEVIRELWPQTATEVSDASHDIRWRTLQDKDPIPYEFAFLSNEVPTEDDVARTEQLVAEFGWER